MTLDTDFASFLQEIRPSDAMRADLKSGHKVLRDRLKGDSSLKEYIISDFLQGSYRRSTAIRPNCERRSDVDIIVVTNLSESEYEPKQAMQFFEPFLEQHYHGKWRMQGRSFGIELSQVELDLVVTSAPSESEVDILQSNAVVSDYSLEEAKDWRLHQSWLPLDSRGQSNARSLIAEAKNGTEWAFKPLRIPDRDTNTWEETHPLAQNQWTRDKNARTDGHFVNVVKAIKWWRVENHEQPKHPKGFPLERIIGETCPDGIKSVAEGVVMTLETIVSRYEQVVKAGDKPVLPDYGVSSHDVLKRITVDDFKMFINQVKEAALLARSAYDSGDRTESGKLWLELFGSKFPKPPGKGGGSGKGYTPPTGPANPGSGRFA